MKLLRHGVSGLVIFALFITLYVGIFTGLEENYPITVNGTKDNQTIAQKLKDLNIIGGFEGLNTAVYDLKPPTGSSIDILGSLAAAAIGSLMLIGGLLTLPIEIIGVITGFYYIPPIVPIVLVVLIGVYVAFILLSAYVGKDV